MTTTPPPSPARPHSWVIDTDTDTGGDVPYPSRLLDPRDADAKAHTLATHDPFVFPADRWSSVNELLDWMLRIAPAWALEVHGHRAIADTVRTLPALPGHRLPGRRVLDRYAAALRTGTAALDEDAHSRERSSGKESTAPSWTVQLPPLVEELYREASVLLQLSRIPSRALVQARSVVWLGRASSVPGLDPGTYAADLETSVRTEIFDCVQACMWIPR